MVMEKRGQEIYMNIEIIWLILGVNEQNRKEGLVLVALQMR